MQEELVSKFPNIYKDLLSLFKESRKLWLNYLPDDKRGAMEKEVNRLDWDPFAYHLGEVEKRSLETFIDYLLKEKMIPRKISLDEIFPKNVKISLES